MRPRAKILAQNLNESYTINEDFIKNIISSILNFLKISRRRVELEVVFLNDGAMRNFNKRYKGRDVPTDVLSFRIDAGEFGLNTFLGEILISADRASHNAALFKTSFERELVLYIIHGILHLFGYDDEDPGERTLMRKKESEILCHLCGREDLSKVLTRR